MKVHRTLDSGFLEAVYEEALEIELKNDKIPFEKQIKLNVFHGDEKLKKYYKADFIYYDKIILEIKSVGFMPQTFQMQLKNYLVSTKIELGILINFGTCSLTYRRILNSKNQRNS
jgi:GxxExxY protein